MSGASRQSGGIYQITQTEDMMALVAELNQAFASIGTILDGLRGLRGTPTFFADVDLQGNNILRLPISSKNANYTTKSSDLTILADSSNGNVTIFLDIEADTGQLHFIKCTSDQNVCAVSPNGNKIDGDRGNLILIKDEVITVQSDSSNNWWII